MYLSNGKSVWPSELALWIKPCCNDVIGQVPEDGALADDGTLSKQPGLRESSVSQGFSPHIQEL